MALNGQAFAVFNTEWHNLKFVINKHGSIYIKRITHQFRNIFLCNPVYNHSDNCFHGNLEHKLHCFDTGN